MTRHQVTLDSSNRFTPCAIKRIAALYVRDTDTYPVTMARMAPGTIDGDPVTFNAAWTVGDVIAHMLSGAVFGDGCHDSRMAHADGYMHSTGYFVPGCDDGYAPETELTVTIETRCAETQTITLLCIHAGTWNRVVAAIDSVHTLRGTMGIRLTTRKTKDGMRRATIRYADSPCR